MSRTLAKQRLKNRWESSPEWYTPPWLLDMVCAFLGPDYLDPCPARNGRPLEVNGLAIAWTGRVFCNPPYGRAIVPWIAKACLEPAEEVLLLIPSYTETKWFRPLFEHTICYLYGRVDYYSPTKNGGGQFNAPHASVLVYRGPRAQAFAAHFGSIGAVMVRHPSGVALAPDLWAAAS